MEGKVHPADPQKVLVRADADDDWTACDNIDGTFDEFLTNEEIAKRESLPSFEFTIEGEG